MSIFYSKKKILMILLNILSVLLMNTLNIKSHKCFAFVRDHGDDFSHLISEQFIQDTFYESGRLSAQKADDFLAKLYRERELLAKDLYETRFLEKLNIDVKSATKSHQVALENQSKSVPILTGFDEFLLPIAESIVKNIRENGSRNESFNALMDTFIQGYTPYFNPGSHRTYWNYDKDMGPIIKNIFRSHRFNENNENDQGSINLTVSAALKSSLESCLNKPLYTGQYLSESDLNKIRNHKCQVDLSVLDPGPSPFWAPPDSRKKEIIGNEYDEHYPDESTKITFKRVRFKGNFSPKLTGTYQKNGRSYKIKIKAGDEVHTEIAVSLLGKHVGYNQDHMRYQSKIKIWLGDLSFENFRSRFAGKYGLNDLVRLVHSHGTAENGEEWLILNDALFEYHPETEYRLSAVDLTSWDLPRRREIQGHFLWKVWLSLGDTKMENYKALFERTEKGLRPLIRLQDAGFALGPAMIFRKPRHILNLTSKYKVNEFETSILSKKSDGTLKLRWNDYFRQKNLDKHVEWNSLKWMARKIASLHEKDIESSLRLSGMPEAVQMVYAHKLKFRRNEIVSAFQLEDEFPLFDLPEIESLQWQDQIKKGKVVATAFEGKNDFVLTRQTWVTFLTSLLNILPDQDVIEKKLGSDWKTMIKGNIKGTESLGTSFSTNALEGSDHKILGEYSLGAGVGIRLGRSVKVSPQLLSAPDENGQLKGRPYMVTDTMSISIGVSTGLLNKILSWFPISAGGDLQVFRIEYRMHQFAETVKKGYLAPFKLIKATNNPEWYALNKMKPLEVWSRDMAWGVTGDLVIKASLPTKEFPVVSTGLGGELSWIYRKPLSLLQDQYGSLHLIKESSHLRSIGGALSLLDVNLFAIRRSLFHVGASGKKQTQVLTDIALEPGQKNKETGATALNQYRNVQMLKTLKKLVKNPDILSSLPAEESKNFVKKLSINGTHKLKTRDWHVGFIFDYFREYASDKVKIVLPDGDSRSFVRKSVVKKNLMGVEKLAIDFGEKNILVPLGNSKRLWVEMDEANPKNFIGVIDVVDYHRTLSRKKVYGLIDELNRRYAPGDDVFYENRELPDVRRVPIYKKVYANTRIYIDGGVLVSKIMDQSYNEFKATARRLFSHNFIDNFCQNESSLSERAGQKLRKRSLKKTFVKLQKILSFESPDTDKLAKYALKFIYEFYNSVLGTKLLEHYLTRDGLLVMGEIYGIHRAYSNLQDLQQFTPRRYMAKHWGHLSHLPPIQRYLRYEQVVLPSVLAGSSVSQQDYFGALYKGLPGNFTGL